jgi:hypothetical protein
VSAEFNAAVALAWAEYTSSTGIAPEKFTDTEKIAFQAGYAAGKADLLRELALPMRHKAWRDEHAA